MKHDRGIVLSNKVIKKLSSVLQKLYTDAFRKVIPDLSIRLERLMSETDGKSDSEKIIMLNRFITQGGFHEYESSIKIANKKAIEEIQQALIAIWLLNYQYNSYDICRQTGLNFDFRVYTYDEIASLLFDIDKSPPFTKIAYKHLGSIKSVTDRLREQMIIATLRGENQNQILKRIKSITGQKVWQARRVAQTERTRVQSQGRYHSGLEAQKMGIELDKQWIARLVRTRERHEHAHMEIVDYNHLFLTKLLYPGDQNSPGSYASNVINCHCYMKTMVKSVSPALAKHREKFREKSFEDYRS